MKAGCQIWLYKPGFHHTKIIMVDGLFCTVGSANLNARSLRWDREENAVIIDACTTHELNQILSSRKKIVSCLQRRNGSNGEHHGNDSEAGLHTFYHLFCNRRKDFKLNLIYIYITVHNGIIVRAETLFTP